ncbi:MAG: transposase [Burkholderiales bacterium]|nr:transposase [Burkholderiales bacterium]
MPYCHLVFTLPHELNALAVHARRVYDTLMQCAAATLSEFAANPRWLGGVGAFTLVLHSWTQDLRRLLHVHALMACGALLDAAGASTWVQPRLGERFLFPVHALSRVFRDKFLDALKRAIEAGALPHDPADTQRACRERVQALRRHDWVVYAKTPLAGLAAVLDYLSRYTYRTAIGNERLVVIDGDKVRLRVRADDTGGKRTIAMNGQQFIGRLLQHVLPPGFKRIRRYGLLAPVTKTQRLALARQLLAMPAANPQAREDVHAFMRRVAPSRSNAARTARSGTGSSPSTWLPIVRPSRPSPPLHAEGRRDPHTQPRALGKVSFQTQARPFVHPARQDRLPTAPASPPNRWGTHNVTILRPWWHPCAPSSAPRRHQRSPLKLTLPTRPPYRRFSSTRFI